MKQSLVFIVGLERSGTTWIGKIVDSHPDVYYLHEPDSYKKFTQTPTVAHLDRYAEYEEELTEFIGHLDATNSADVLGKLPLFPKSYHNKFVYYCNSMLIYAGKLSQQLGLPLNFPCWNHLPERTAIKIAWKSIDSVGRVGVINQCKPNCQGVLLLRHPCGQIASIIVGSQKNKFSSKRHLSEKYKTFEKLMETDSAKKRGLCMSDIKKMTPVERLAWRWTLFNEKAMLEIEGLNNWSTLVYDDFVNDPMASTEKLYVLLNLFWNQQTEAFVQRSIASNNPNYYSLCKSPRKAANKWKELLPQEDIQRIKLIVKDSLPGKLFDFP